MIAKRFGWDVELGLGRGGLRLPTLLLTLVTAMACSCQSCGGSSGTGYSSGGGGTSSGSHWLVGEAGTMLNLRHAELDQIGHYDIDVKDDLLGIACRGTEEAWVVGAHGRMIATSDGGDTWRNLDPGVTGTLRSVALAGESTVFVAGDDGVFRVSDDDGETWRAVASPTLAWTSVGAHKQTGDYALVSSSEGEVYRYDAATSTLTRAGGAGVALFSVVVSRNGEAAMAVGDHGTMLVSHDGGRSFSPREPVTTVAVRDTWLIGDTGDRFMSVGDGGQVILGALLAGSVQTQTLGADLHLRAIHLESTGRGMIVGDGGAAFFTEDLGASWKRVDTGETQALYGVDALEAGAHL